MRITSHNKFIQVFKRDAALLLENHIPGKVHLARQDINSFLKKERGQLRRWHIGLLFDILTSEEFVKLFNGLRNAFKPKKLKKAGLSDETLAEVTELLRKLFRAMLIACSQKEKD